MPVDLLIYVGTIDERVLRDKVREGTLRMLRTERKSNVHEDSCPSVPMLAALKTCTGGMLSLSSRITCLNRSSCSTPGSKALIPQSPACSTLIATIRFPDFQNKRKRTIPQASSPGWHNCVCEHETRNKFSCTSPFEAVLVFRIQPRPCSALPGLFSTNYHLQMLEDVLPECSSPHACMKQVIAAPIVVLRFSVS